jgi:hypothetical protein
MTRHWRVSLCTALALAWAVSAPADVIPNPDPSSDTTNSSPATTNSGSIFNNLDAAPTFRNTCGMLGGATLSILLTVSGCWVVHVHSRRRR